MPTPTIRWRQAPRSPISKQRDPVQGEFFNSESIPTLAAKLTREGIGQNPLDAGVASPVKVRVHVSGQRGAVSPSDAQAYFEGLRQHVAAIHSDAASQFDRPCRYIVVEDFNTTGLTGDPTSTEEPRPGMRNDFFYFYRAEGKSGKSGADRGRWGVGKYVFPMASHINTFFGLTVRDRNADSEYPGPLLMGQTVLRNHQLADGSSYEPDGWWADFEASGLPVPIRDAATISRFCSTWNVQRLTESGLSVVIPYVREDLSANDLALAIVHDYYLAVLSGKFVAEVTSADLPSPITIAPDTLDDVVDIFPAGDARDELHRQIAVARWHRQLAPGEFVQAGRSAAGPPKWEPDLIAEADRLRIRAALDDGEEIAVRVPVEVGLQGEPTGHWSWFDVVFSPESGHAGKPQFVREGLFVPEVRSARLSGLRCLVVVEDSKLAQMVGDAEGPAHTNWSAQTQKFSGKYRYGQQWLTFVKRAPTDILRIVRGEDEDADPTLLSRYFPSPADMGPTGPKGPSGPAGPGPVPPPPAPPPPAPRRVRVDRIAGGFSVHLTGHGDVKDIQVRIAYDRRGGNPFKRWRGEDFDLDGVGITKTVAGGRIREISGNKLVVAVEDQSAFALHVRGFDERRDLRVDARAEAAE